MWQTNTWPEWLFVWDNARSLDIREIGNMEHTSSEWYFPGFLEFHLEDHCPLCYQGLTLGFVLPVTNVPCVALSSSRNWRSRGQCGRSQRSWNAFDEHSEHVPGAALQPQAPDCIILLSILVSPFEMLRDFTGSSLTPLGLPECVNVSRKKDIWAEDKFHHIEK